MAEKRVKIEFLAIWENTGKDGTKYYTGKLNGARVVGWQNTRKKNEKEPDFRFFLEEAQSDNAPRDEDDESIPF